MVSLLQKMCNTFTTLFKVFDNLSMRCNVLTLLLVAIGGIPLLSAQTTVFAYLKDQEGKPVERAIVDLIRSDNDLIADKIGYFQFVNLEPGIYKMRISKTGLMSREIEFEVDPSLRRQDLGVISMLPSSKEHSLSVSAVSENLTSDNMSLEPSIALLTNKGSVYTQLISGDMRWYRYMPRAMDNSEHSILINSTPAINTGALQGDLLFTPLSAFASLPIELTESYQPHASRTKSGAILEFTTRPSQIPKGTKIGYNYSTGTLPNRLELFHASGESTTGWSIAFGLSPEWGADRKVAGIDGNRLGYFASVERALNPKTSIHFTTYAQSDQTGLRSSLDSNRGSENHFENGFWGVDMNQIRNARSRSYFLPVYQLGFTYLPSKTTEWETLLSLQQGTIRESRLEWDKSDVPYAFHPTRSKSNGESGPINWDNLREDNFSQAKADYYMADDVHQIRTLSALTSYAIRVSPHFNIKSQLQIRTGESIKYRELNDLLGASYALNRNPFTSLQYNTLESSVQKTEGERIGYDYAIEENSLQWGIYGSYKRKKWNAQASAFAMLHNSRRIGRMLPEGTEESDWGESPMRSGVDSGINTKVDFLINSKNTLSASAFYHALTAGIRQLLKDPLFSNSIYDMENSTKKMGAEVSYHLTLEKLKLTASAYYQKAQNEIQHWNYFTDHNYAGPLDYLGNTYINESWIGLDRESRGLELGAQWNFKKNFTLFTAAALNNSSIKNDPLLHYSSSQIEHTDKRAPLSGERLSGSAQNNITAGLRYDNPKLFWARISAIYLDALYPEFSALSRTELSEESLPSGINSAYPHGLPTQRELPSYFLMNFTAGKTFSIGRYEIGLNLEIINLLDNTEYTPASRESLGILKFDSALQRPYEPSAYNQYYYDRGRRIFAGLYFKF